MKYVEPRPYADPARAARRLLEIANTIEPVQDGRIHIESSTGRPYSRKAARGSTGCIDLGHYARAGRSL
jgi:hypothetical protein